MAKPIGTLGTIDTLTVGGRVFTDLSTIKILGGFAADTNRAALRLSSGSAGYAVTGGTTLTIYAIRMRTGVALSATQTVSTCVLAQMDTDLGLNSASAFSNPVYPFGSASVTSAMIADGTSGNKTEEFGGMNFPVAAGKYLGFLATGTTIYLSVYGYEA